MTKFWVFGVWGPQLSISCLLHWSPLAGRISHRKQKVCMSAGGTLRTLEHSQPNLCKQRSEHLSVFYFSVVWLCLPEEKTRYCWHLWDLWESELLRNGKGARVCAYIMSLHEAPRINRGAFLEGSSSAGEISGLFINSNTTFFSKLIKPLYSN